MSFSPDSRIDIDRYWSTIESSAEIGPGRPGGLARLALSDDDRKMRDLFIRWCREADLGVTVDELGNIFARREGSDSTLPPVLIGSHLDTQVNGGRFDGIAGVLAGLEVVRILNDIGHVTRRPIVVVDWTNEEGARFAPPMVASGCFVGAYDADWVRSLEASDGVRFGAELERIGYNGDVPCRAAEISAYYELHIEQGPILDYEKRDVGIVTGGYATHGMRARFAGKTAHTGPTPMDLRHNALVAGARWLTAVDDIGWDFAGGDGKASGAQLTACPNKAGILSDTAQAICDVRHPEPATARVMCEKMRRAVFESAARAGCEAAIEDEWFWGGDMFDHDMVNGIREAANQLRYNWRDIQAQAGHDAYFLARHCPTAMIFTPCKGGITHNNEESCDRDDLSPGANVLLHAVVARADK